MALSNTATPIYYGRFREAVMRGEIPVCREISMEMNRIDDLIANPGVYYDDKAMDGFVKFCERELTLTDGTDLKLLETFKLWAEQGLNEYGAIQKDGTVDCGEIDAACADEIVQLALFGEVQFA